MYEQIDKKKIQIKKFAHEKTQVRGVFTAPCTRPLNRDVDALTTHLIYTYLYYLQSYCCRNNLSNFQPCSPLLILIVTPSVDTFSILLFTGGSKRATRVTIATAVGIWILAALLATPAYVGSYLRAFVVNPTTQVTSYSKRRLLSTISCTRQV